MIVAVDVVRAAAAVRPELAVRAVVLLPEVLLGVSSRGGARHAVLWRAAIIALVCALSGVVARRCVTHHHRSHPAIRRAVCRLPGAPPGKRRRDRGARRGLPVRLTGTSRLDAVPWRTNARDDVSRHGWVSMVTGDAMDMLSTARRLSLPDG